MSEIKKLIERLCPEGVEFKTLGELGTFYGGLTGKSKKDFGNGNAKFITYMNVFSNPALDLSVTDTVQIAEGEKQNKVQYKDILFTGSSETPEESGMTSVVTQEIQEDYYLNSFCFGLRLYDPEIFNADFLKHYLRSHEARKAIAKTASGVTRFNISKAKLANLEIPVPDIPIQQEIARILDKFALLEAELETKLEAELEARRKQYEYYRNELLNFAPPRSENVKWIRLMDILEQPITDGPHETPKFYDEGVPFISVDAIVNNQIDFEKKRGFISEEYDNLCRKKYAPQLHDIYLVKSGSTTGKVAIVKTNERFNIWSPLAAIRVNKNNNPFYVYYVLQTKRVQNQIKHKCSKGSQPNLSMRVLEKFIIPVPPKEEQQRIVSILNRLESLTTDLQSCLPAEKAARRKQYEYYREKLLTFKRKTA